MANPNPDPDSNPDPNPDPNHRSSQPLQRPRSVGTVASHRRDAREPRVAGMARFGVAVGGGGGGGGGGEEENAFDTAAADSPPRIGSAPACVSQARLQLTTILPTNYCYPTTHSLLSYLPATIILTYSPIPTYLPRRGCIVRCSVTRACAEMRREGRREMRLEGRRAAAVPRQPPPALPAPRLGVPPAQRVPPRQPARAPWRVRPRARLLARLPARAPAAFVLRRPNGE